MAKDGKKKLADEDRSATGRGYDARRRKEPMSSNPFDASTPQWGYWRSGWLRAKADEEEDCEESK